MRKSLVGLIPLFALVLTGCQEKISVAVAEEVAIAAQENEDLITTGIFTSDSEHSFTMSTPATVAEPAASMEESMTMNVKLTLIDGPQYEYIEESQWTVEETVGSETSTHGIDPETLRLYQKDGQGYADFTDAPERFEDYVYDSQAPKKLQMNIDNFGLADDAIASPRDTLAEMLDMLEYFEQIDAASATQGNGTTSLLIEVDTQKFGEMSDIMDAVGDSQPVPTSFPDYSDGYVETDGTTTNTTIVNEYSIKFVFNNDNFLVGVHMLMDVEITSTGSEWFNGTTYIVTKSHEYRDRINDAGLTIAWPADLNTYSPLVV